MITLVSLVYYLGSVVIGKECKNQIDRLLSSDFLIPGRLRRRQRRVNFSASDLLTFCSSNLLSIPLSTDSKD